MLEEFRRVEARAANLSLFECFCLMTDVGTDQLVAVLESGGRVR